MLSRTRTVAPLAARLAAFRQAEMLRPALAPLMVRHKGSLVRPRNVFPTFSDDDPFFGNIWRSTFGDMGTNFRSSLGSTDVLETDKAHIFRMDAPGMSAKDIKVQVHDNRILTVSGQREEKLQEKDDKTHYHRVERRQGSFSRSFQLPDDCDHTQVQASFKDGVLSVTVPKTEQPPSRSIDVEVKPAE